MQFKNTHIDLSTPQIMGVLNVTPDSFSDGARYNQLDAACRHAESMIADGASFIDVGGESTRPGASEVPVEEELARVLPIIEALAKRFDAVISVDTSKAEVMREAVLAGAGLINDVRALQEPGAMNAALQAQVPVCLMHMQGKPGNMQDAPQYDSVLAQVTQFLEQRIMACEQAGITRSKLIIDPGFGFGKTLEHNYQLLAKLKQLHKMGLPLLVGMSRKSMLGDLLNRTVDQRLAGGIAVAVIAAQQGAQIIRVHDVKETADAVKVVQMLSSL